ncbi:uncharacterized protein LOC142320507 isoform X2 [Lycorma delicatula]|uniref:uncharacterized protein LOC142320507 isoform X2 n=1 Tax=Lycorma delicatula TaxID=130591 RepID=UPI003F5172D9
MISRMCLYVRLLGSLGKNLITRIGSELADCLVATKQCIVYRLCGCFCKSTDDDDVGSETPVTSQPESIHQLQPDECPDGEYDLTAEIGHQAWFHRVDRRTAQEMVRNGGQGCFLVRPSGSGNNALTLTLWHRHRPFNILIRHREDGLFALGTRKQNEPKKMTSCLNLQGKQHKECHRKNTALKIGTWNVRTLLPSGICFS